MECNLEMPVNIIPFCHLPGDILFGYDMHDNQVQHKHSKSHCDIINIPEEVHIGIILIEVRIRCIV